MNLARAGDVMPTSHSDLVLADVRTASLSAVGSCFPVLPAFYVSVRLINVFTRAAAVRAASGLMLSFHLHLAHPSPSLE
jgi:hypothetical protein